MNLLTKYIIAVFSILFVANFAFAEKEEILATVGNSKITLQEFNKKLTEVKSQTMNPPTKEQFLEDMIRYEIGVQEAEKRKLENDPIVKERVRQEMYKALLEKDIGHQVQSLPVTDAEMKEWYKTNPEIRTSHILIELKPDATSEQRAEAKKRALEILDEVKKSKRPFEELVKLYSDDPFSKQSGGDTGWQSRVTIMPNYYEAALSMKVGEIKGLIDTQFGYHIIKLTGRKTYEEADKKAIRIAVFDEKRKKTFNDYFDKLKKKYSIKVNSSLLKK